jgi:S-DNA-T family DNA segregation ATPase FtsK/SpoIIIE
MAAADKNQGAPLPAKLASLLREAKWLLAVALAAYLLLILATFHRDDPSWSFAATGAVAQNAGGRFGASVAAVLLHLFGLSAYWWVALCLLVVAWGYHWLDGRTLVDRRPLWIALGGFVALLVSSAALESLRFYSVRATLPDVPGGIVGHAAAGITSGVFGFTGATLVLVTLVAIGFSLFTGISWVALARRPAWCSKARSRWCGRIWEQRRDRKIGEIAREERDFVVEAEKRREEDHPPLVIAPPPPEIKKSERVQKEKQAPLFEDLPDTPLPPIKLLDEAVAETEQVGAETLEYTSRLIEKKLSDFGVSVKVLAAYPGPVITRYEIEPAVGVKGSQIVNLVEGPRARAVGGRDPRRRDDPGQVVHGARDPESAPADGAPLRDPRLGVLSQRAFEPCARARQGYRGNPVIADLGKMPHLLVAGTTGSGKSVAINAMILSLLYKSEPRHVRMILVDPKMLELSVYPGHSASARAGRHRHEAGRERAQLVHRGDGPALPRDVVARRAQPLGLQPQDRGCGKARPHDRGSEHAGVGRAAAAEGAAGDRRRHRRTCGPDDGRR